MVARVPVALQYATDIISFHQIDSLLFLINKISGYESQMPLQKNALHLHTTAH